MPRSAKIVRGHRYQIGRFAGSWYVADLDQNRFVYGPFLRRETAEARLQKIVHMSRIRNPLNKFSIGDVVYVDRSKVAPSLAKNLFWRVFVDPAVIREISKTRYRIEFPFGKSYWFDLESLRKTQSNPEWKPPFAKRKRKRLGALYQKAFAKFSKENPRKRGVLIYGRVLKIFAQKTEGPYKGQQFVHTFKPGAIMMGLPDGSIKISHP